MPHAIRSALALLACLAAACGRAEGVQTARVQRRDVRVATPVPTVTHPLTGVELPDGQPWQRRAVLSVKVENSRPARPQAGLEAADLVYEELAEGGITRFIAVFHSSDAPKVGPVRSARRTDADVLAPLGGLFAFAGGVPPVIAAVRAAGTLQDVSVNRAPDAYYRAADRPAPHNLYTSTAALWRGRGGSPPAPHFAFLPAGAPAGGGAPATTVSFSFSMEPTRYEYDSASGTYRRFQNGSPHLLEGGVQVAPVNVLIQVVEVTEGGVVDVNGQPSPDSRVVGEGEAILLRGGQAFRGRWVRPAAGTPTRFVDAAGNPLLLARGQTWIELLPRGRPVALG